MNDQEKVEKGEFVPTSDNIQHVETSLGYPIPTLISYQFGKVDGKHAIRFYINGIEEDTRILNRQISPAHFKLYRSGGQTLMSARRQREKCLETIVERYFINFGIKVKKQPLLGDFTPDVLIKKGNHACYIELKAFHESYICGDPEISQAMKYFEYIKQNHASQENKDLNSETQKVILITSGTLKPPEDLFFNNPKMDAYQFISNYYKQKVLPRKKIASLDGLSARDIYRQASKKFKRQLAQGFSPMRVVFFKEVNISYFPKYLFKVTNFDVLIMSSDNFYQILKNANMHSLANKFDLLRRKTLEQLIIDGKLLKI